MATNENLPPNVIKQLAKELRSLDESPPEGITVGVNDDDFLTIFADIEGPAETPYENGVFRMKLLLSNDFPHSPPKGYFLTKIFHPNIATNESALNEQAGKMLLENYEEYARHARLYTGIHAKPRHKFKSGAISVSNNTPKLDQSHVTVIGADQKNSAASTVPPVPSPLTSSTTITNIGNSQDQPSLVPPKIEKSILGSTAAAAGGPLRKESGLAKVHANRKKTDARKKSLKRL